MTFFPDQIIGGYRVRDLIRVSGVLDRAGLFNERGLEQDQKRAELLSDLEAMFAMRETFAVKSVLLAARIELLELKIKKDQSHREELALLQRDLG